MTDGADRVGAPPWPGRDRTGAGPPQAAAAAGVPPQVSRDDLLADLLPHERRDDLLAELQAVRLTRERVDGLLEAVVAVGSNLDLQTVLHGIVDAAVTLVDASFGALGVLSEDGTQLAQFLVVGVDDELVARVGGLPQGHGVLGELIRNPRPLRLPDIGEHPASFGFPAGHPPMHTFLGVPLRVRDVVFGNLYLTEKRGGLDFDEQDESVLLALAAAAGVAVENARLYDASRRRERWLEASAEVSTALLSGALPEQVLALVAARARDVTGAELAVVALPLPDERLLVEAVDGAAGGPVVGQVLSVAGEGLRAVLAGGEGRVLSPGELHPAVRGAGFAVPLTGEERGRGVLAVTGLPAEDELGVRRALTSFAAQASIALELAERRRDGERYAVFEDRDRIARDLHDLVIQRLFATGMQLESAVRLMAGRPEEAAARVHAAVDDLDATIRELRSTIYGLQAPADGTAASLRAQVLQVVDAAGDRLGFAPSLRLDGLLDTLVPDQVAEHALAVLREALSNAARHARAGNVEVRVGAEKGELTVEVRDDGVGMPGGGRRSGLDNLAGRALQLGGTLAIGSGPAGGTELAWRVPLVRT